MQQILKTLANARSVAGAALTIVATMGFGLATPCFAQNAAPPDFGLDLVTVGAPGNDPVPEELFIEFPNLFIPMGAVDYEYRIMRTEITVGQWFEFVLAYLPFYTGNEVNTEFHGRGISWSPSGYFLNDPPDHPNTMSWEFAARYCNWLHNGKALTADAFENGVYDTTTFTRNADGTLNHQVGHHAGALFWIPTHDEWVKAVYYDPNRFSPGQGGWWYNPGSQDALLISGLPGAGQTNAGVNGAETPVGSYPNVQSPWGLLDASGGENEWTETISHPIFGMFTRSSDAGDSSYDRNDPIEIVFRETGPTAAFIGVRLASAVQVPACPGDANIDGEVNFSDVTNVLGNWLGDGSAGGDSNADGLVDFADITSVLTNWQVACP